MNSPFKVGFEEGCLIIVAISGGLLWCINGLSRSDYSFSGGVWAGPIMSVAALLYVYWRLNRD